MGPGEPREAMQLLLFAPRDLRRETLGSLISSLSGSGNSLYCVGYC